MNMELRQYKNGHSLECKMKRFLWKILWACAAQFTPRWCLNGWRCNLLRLFGAKVGHGCRINGGAKVWLPENLEIGDDCWIDDNTNIYCVDKILIGSNSVVSSGAFLCAAGHDITRTTFDLCTKPISVGESVWIASNAIVLPGRCIGDGAVVAAGAVVTNDVEPWTVVGGNPAVVIKKRAISS